MSIDVEKGIYQDFSTGESGGILALIEAKSGQNAIDWLVKNSFIRDTRGKAKGVDISALLDGMNKAPQAVEGSKEKPLSLSLEQLPESYAAPTPKKPETYVYCDEHGQPTIKLERTYQGNKRMFAQYRFDDMIGVWISGLRDKKGNRIAPHHLYRLPQLIESTDVVHLCEGEKCADRLAGLGLTATTSGSASSWLDEFAQYFAGRDVVLWQDNGAIGDKYAQNVIKSLSGVVKTIKRINLAHHVKNAPDGYDVADFIDNGGQREQLEAIAQKTPFFEPSNDDAPAPKKSCIVSFDQLLEHQDPPAWLIKKVLLEHGTTTLFAESGAGKSFVAIDMALHIAAGRDWQGHKTKVGHVAYIAAEGVDGFTYRVKAWVNHHQARPVEGGSFHVITKGFAINEPHELAQLVNELDSLPNKPNLIIIDTLARNFTGDENHATAMGLYIRGADFMRDRYHCNVLTIHHAGKGDLDSARGSTALKGAMDRELKLLNKDGYKVLSDGKVKDGREGQILTFELLDVDTGVIDEDGEPVGSAVINAVNAATGRKVKKLTDTMRLGVETFARVAYQHRADVEAWRVEYYRSSSRDGLDNKRSAFTQVRSMLTSKGIMTVDNDVYTLNQNTDYPEITGIMVMANFLKAQERDDDSANDDFFNESA